MSRLKHIDLKAASAEWVGTIPAHWKETRLRFVADISNSNVDKKEYEGQVPVRLCNYTDVYYNETITPDLDFMVATASKSEIKKFGLKKGDVIITKDSEDALDIGVPAIVECDMPGVVCGYHLSVIRAKDPITADFIRYSFMSDLNKARMYVRTPGITRFGLNQDTIKSILIIMPPMEERKQIVCWLRNQTTQIDGLIEKKGRFIALLKEKRAAVITHAVTKGVDPGVAMKDSGIEWVGYIPSHWKVSPLKHLLQHSLQYGATEAGDVFREDWPRYIRITDITMEGKLRSGGAKSLAPELARHYPVKNGDILLARSGATVGKSFLYEGQDNEACFAGYMIRASSDRQKLLPEYLNFYFQSHTYWEFIIGTQSQSTIQNVSAEKYSVLPVTVPSLFEQEEICRQLYLETARIDGLIAKTTHSIDLLKEKRSALITAAVTGKIDVRNAA